MATKPRGGGAKGLSGFKASLVYILATDIERNGNIQYIARYTI